MQDDRKGVASRSRARFPRPGIHFLDRKTPVLKSLAQLFNTGRLARTGYLSILPVDQGIEHSAGASFAPNPLYFDPENIVKLAIEGGCNAVASTFGVLGSVARKYAHKIPFIVKINHNEFLSYPNTYDQIMFGDVEMAFEMGAVAVGRRSISAPRNQNVRYRKSLRHSSTRTRWAWRRYSGATCVMRHSRRRRKDFHVSADLTGQANHLGVTIEADIIKQKLPENNGGYTALNFGKTSKKVYTSLPPTIRLT